MFMKKIQFLIIWIICFLWIPVSAFGQIPDSFFDWESGKGLFSSQYVDGKCFWNIPDSLSGRDFSLFVSILNGPLKKRTENEKQGYAGDRYGPKILRFVREGDEILLYQLTGYVKPGTSAEYHLFAEKESCILMRRFPILLRTGKNSRIDVTDFLTDDFYFGLGAYAFSMGLGMAEDISTTEILGREDAMLIRSERIYTPQFPRGKKTRWRVGACLQLLPVKQAAIRFASPLIGFFSLPFADWSLAGEQTIDVIRRWRLEVDDKDLAAYLSGQIVRPVNPICFALSPDFPPLLRPAVRESVASWNRVFEAAGFRDALLLYEPDTAVYDDSRLSWIVMKTSPVPNAYGKSFADPRTGEILSAHVSIFQGISKVLQRWFTTQTGLLRDLNEKEACRLLRLVVEHELGHVLGLAHNFYGSTLLTTEQLRDSSVANKHFFGSSIMDYMRINYAAQPSDSIEFFDRVATIGPYDTCAINWGYRYLGGSSESEKQELDHYLIRMQKDRRYRFLKEDVRNPETLSEDLGRNNLQTAVLGMNYLHMALKDNSSSDSIREKRQTDILEQYKNYMSQALSYIGGYRYQDSDWPYCREAVNIEEQHAALAFIQKYYVDNVLNIPADRLASLDSEIVPVLVDRLFAFAPKANSCLSYDKTNAYLKNLTEIFVAGRPQKFTWWRIHLLRLYYAQLCEAVKKAAIEDLELQRIFLKEQKKILYSCRRLERHLQGSLFYDLDSLAYEN